MTLRVGHYRLGAQMRLALAEGDRKVPEFDLASYDVPAGLKLGTPFRTLSAGWVSSRYSGRPLGGHISVNILHEMVRVFHRRMAEDPVLLDWNHESAPSFWSASGPVDVAGGVGRVMDLMVFDDGERGHGLYVLPAYSERGQKLVEDQKGMLYSSPEFYVGPVYARESDGIKTGDAQMMAVALTPRPAQSATKIDLIQLSEDAPPIHLLGAPVPDSPAGQAGIQTEEAPMDAKALAERNALLEREMAELKTKLGEQTKRADVLQADLDQARTSADGEVKALRERIEAHEKALDGERFSAALSELQRTGKVGTTEAEVEAARTKWELRDSYPNLWAELEGRPKGFAAPARAALGEERGISGAAEVGGLDMQLGELADKKGGVELAFNELQQTQGAVMAEIFKFEGRGR